MSGRSNCCFGPLVGSFADSQRLSLPNGVTDRIVLPFLIAVLLIPSLADAQSLVDSSTIAGTLARFAGQMGETPLRCEVTPIKPALNFGFRLEAGYTFRVPLNQFSGPDHSLTVVTRIATEGSLPPVFLLDTLRLPPVPPTGIEGEFGGGFFLGEGHYRVNWMLIDDRGRTCFKDWQLDAELGRGDRLVKLVMPPNTVAELSLRASPAADRHPDSVRPMRLAILLDAAPLSGGGNRSSLSSSDQVFLLGALSALLERVPATSVRLVAFNLEQQKEIFRRDGFTLDSLDEVAGSLDQLQLAKVDYQALQFPTGHLDLLARLINQELRAEPPSDAVIFLGPRERFHEKLAADALDKSRGEVPRFFFLPYQAPLDLPDPQAPRTLRDPMSGPGGRGGVRGGGTPSLLSAPDMMSGPPPGDRGDDTSGGWGAGSLRTTLPDSQERLPDTVSLAVARLKGKTIPLQSPDQFAKAIEQIERSSSH